MKMFSAALFGLALLFGLSSSATAQRVQLPPNLSVDVTGIDQPSCMIPGNKCRTVQFILDTWAQLYDAMGQPVVITLCAPAGTPALFPGWYWSGQMPGQYRGTGGLSFIGCPQNIPAVVPFYLTQLVNGVQRDPSVKYPDYDISSSGISAGDYAAFSVRGFAFNSTFVSRTGVQACDLITTSNATIRFGSIIFQQAGPGECNHLTLGFHSVGYVDQSYSVTGGGGCHGSLGDGSTIYYETNGNPGVLGVQILGGPVVMSTAWWCADSGTTSNVQAVNWADSVGVIGKRFNIQHNGVISTRDLHGVQYSFPGNLTGTFVPTPQGTFGIYD